MKEIHAENDAWRLTYVQDEGQPSQSITGNGLVITGPGPAKPIEIRPDGIYQRVLDGQTFWQNLDKFTDIPFGEEPIGVIGSGETAASVVIALLQNLENEIPILVMNRQGAIFSRGESYGENRVFSDPEEAGWSDFSYSDREEFIKRTDRGVFSLDSKALIDGCRHVTHMRVDVEHIKIVDEFGEDRPRVIGPYTNVQQEIPLSYVIVAVGFNPWWFTDCIHGPLKGFMLDTDHRKILERDIEYDLSLPSRQVSPKLFVPMLAGYAQGPGFPNLSCLGNLSDRILGAYVTAP